MKPIQRRRVGRTDVEVTALSLGTTIVGNRYGAISEAQATDVIDAAWDAGVRFFDTAPMYGHGLAELRVGAALRERDPTSFTVATKVGRILKSRPRADIDFGTWVDVPAFDMVYDYSYDGTMRSFEDSMTRLGLDRVDILFIHDIDRRTRGDEQPEVFREAMDGSWRALEALRNDGTVKAIGVGVNEWEVCQEALLLHDFDCFLLAGRYTLLDQGSLDTFLPLCEERNASVVVGGGFNSGILATGARPGARYDYAEASPAILAKVEAITRVCESHGVALQSAAMQFITAHPAVATLNVGARSREQFAQSAVWYGADIPDSLWSDLKQEGLLRQDAPTRAAASQ